MAPGRGCFGLAILLAIVDIQLGGEDSPSQVPRAETANRENPALMRSPVESHAFFLVGKDLLFLTLRKGWKMWFFFFVRILLPTSSDILPLPCIAKSLVISPSI